MRPDNDPGGPDDRGHGIGRRFEGPGDSINFVAPNANLNRGALQALEDQMALEMRDCHQVHFGEEMIYVAGSQRPAGFLVSYRVDDGPTRNQFFCNERGGLPADHP